MMDASSRRGFLRGLTTLPLIGGGVALIGTPSAVAEPATVPLLRRYVAFLGREFGQAHDALMALDPVPNLWGSAPDRPIADIYLFHRQKDATVDAFMAAAPSTTRAALVLATVGLDFRGGIR